MKAEAVLVALGYPYFYFFSFLSYLVHWVVLEIKIFNKYSYTLLWSAKPRLHAWSCACHFSLWRNQEPTVFSWFRQPPPHDNHQVHLPLAAVWKLMPPGICGVHIPGGIRSTEEMSFLPLFIGSWLSLSGSDSQLPDDAHQDHPPLTTMLKLMLPRISGVHLSGGFRNRGDFTLACVYREPAVSSWFRQPSPWWCPPLAAVLKLKPPQVCGVQIPGSFMSRDLILTYVHQELVVSSWIR